MKSPVIDPKTPERSLENLRSWFRDLDLAGGVAAALAVGVTTFNKRKGLVMPAKGDYSVDQVTGLTAALADKQGHTEALDAIEGQASAIVTGYLDKDDWSAFNDKAPAFTGLTVVITTAALTTLGTQGSMTFTNGVLTAQTQAT